MSLPVSKGLYSVLLGDTTVAGMSAILPSVFANPDVRLRVWFNNGVNGSQRLTPDQRLAPAPYVADGAVTSGSIAPGAVTASDIAPGAVSSTHVAAGSLDFSRLNVPAAPGSGQVLSFNGTGLNWTTPTTGAVLALPYSGSQLSFGTLSSITNTGTFQSSRAIHGQSAGSTGVYGLTQGNSASGVY